ncbi:D-xylose 1-dehydrogenase Gfo6 [Saliphagus infecundisoli]|uniref:D-xylose 1-dehydrogenase Gfo6 n=1 Tax=Saliphagus infecundisoli TaxID=1849069 RepID=A0ABD5Q972_9EURY|nr:D-xylose 1-dehydrogenase Gfo6 [Saliphagus infecundisoli]
MLQNLARDEMARRDWDSGINTTVRFALVGLGGFTEGVVLSAIQETDYCTATVGITGTPETGERLADEYNLKRVLSYDEFHDGEGVDDYDAVYVCTPNALHLEYAESAADLGKPVLCEKPLEATTERARRLRDACNEAGVTLMTAYRMQLEPVTRRLREWVRDGELGDIVAVRGSLDIDVPTDQWRFDETLAGGGAMMDIGIYPLNTSRFVLDAEPTTVTAQTASPREIEVDEHVAFQLSFPKGVTAHGQASFEAQPKTEFQLVGTAATVSFSPAFSVAQDRTVEIHKDGQMTELETNWGHEVIEEFDYFAHCLETGTNPAPDGDEGIRDLEIVDAIYKSVMMDETIPL